jgi:SAM-dependent methyltransferase
MEIVKEMRQSTWSVKACDVCGEQERISLLEERSFHLETRHSVFEFPMSYVVCERCGFVFVGRIPEDAFLFDFYRDAHTLQSEYRSIAPEFNVAARLDTIGKFQAQDSYILEIGANDGAFTDVLIRSGYHARGFDPLENHGSGAVFQYFLDRGKSCKDGVTEQFDAVVSYYVLEHIVDANTWLRVAGSYLRDGGILIIEVPNFVQHPLESIFPEHFLHFTPFHLSKLLERTGFKILSIDSEIPSRGFGFVTVARYHKRQQAVCSAPLDLCTEVERVSLVRLAREKYGMARKLERDEELRIQKLAWEILKRSDNEHRDRGSVIFWAANKYATRITQALSGRCKEKLCIVDNAATKIGTWHLGFSEPISPPLFEKRVAGHRIFILCSPSWNYEIHAQILGMNLENISIIDAIAWRGDQGCK